MLVPQPVGGTVVGDLPRADVDDDLKGVHVRRPARPAEVVAAVHVHAVDLENPFAGLLSEGECVVVEGLAVLDHLPAPAVQRRVYEGRGAGGPQQVLTALERLRLDQIPLEVEDGALFEAGAHLVNGGDAHVGAGVHGPGGKIGVERQVGAPCLVDDQGPVPAVADLGDGGEVRAGAVGGWEWSPARRGRPGARRRPPRRPRRTEGGRGGARHPIADPPRRARCPRGSGPTPRICGRPGRPAASPAVRQRTAWRTSPTGSCRRWRRTRAGPAPGSREDRKASAAFQGRDAGHHPVGDAQRIEGGTLRRRGCRTMWPRPGMYPSASRPVRSPRSRTPVGRDTARAGPLV